MKKFICEVGSTFLAIVYALGYVVLTITGVRLVANLVRIGWGRLKSS